jgi:hypothetical protein
MAIGRSQMSQQVTNPPMKRKVKKNAKRRMLPKGKSKVQSVSKRIRKRNSKKKPVKKAMGGEIMPSNEFRKRPVRRMLGGGEAIANGCGKVMTNRRKVTKLS